MEGALWHDLPRDSVWPFLRRPRPHWLSRSVILFVQSCQISLLSFLSCILTLSSDLRFEQIFIFSASTTSIFPRHSSQHSNFPIPIPFLLQLNFSEWCRPYQSNGGQRRTRHTSGLARISHMAEPGCSTPWALSRTWQSRSTTLRAWSETPSSRPLSPNLPSPSSPTPATTTILTWPGMVTPGYLIQRSILNYSLD